MKQKYKRLTFVLVAFLLMGTATALVLIAFEDNVVFFYGPTEILSKSPLPNKLIRLGGLVQNNSIRKRKNSQITFKVTDMQNVISVNFTGILPDLFREGQGVVAEGYLVKGVFTARTILAKHDENYMPAEVAAALKSSGKWQGKP